MLLIHIYTSFSTTELTAVAYTLASFCYIYPMYLPSWLFQKGTLRGFFYGIIKLPQILVVEAKAAGCPSNISMFRYNDGCKGEDKLS